MQVQLAAAIIILILVGIILSFRLWCYRKQIHHMKEELALMEKEDTNYQLSSFCPGGETEEVITIVNKLILRYKEEENRLKRENKIYRESITSISHDIRTPLTSAKGYLQMLQKGSMEEKKKLEYVKIVEQRLDHVTDMLNQLFEYARIEAGEMELEPEIFQVGNLFAETISLFYEDFLKKNCQPEVTITQQSCKIRADKHAFVRIIENLIKNALVHGTGGYQLSLTQEENMAKIRVSNLTDSIEKKDMDKIFDRFYTTDQSRSRKTTGLGLAIVKRFTIQMGGTIKADLEEKRFTIEIGIPLVLDESI
ncbi:MAG: HAMP domain-containing histidine kinase [Lachnospiraceae bacterium]|nr:HAMP domain-containing histidine kinase [Lachnospiraceae bacterium]